MCVILLPKDFLMTGRMTDQINQQRFRFLRIIIVRCHYNRLIGRMWTRVVMINSQNHESRGDMHRVGYAEPNTSARWPACPHDQVIRAL